MNEGVMCYVGMCGCGCGGYIAVTVDEPRLRHDTASFVSDLIRNGSVVQRATVAEARQNFGCKARMAAKAGA